MWNSTKRKRHFRRRKTEMGKAMSQMKGRRLYAALLNGDLAKRPTFRPNRLVSAIRSVMPWKRPNMNEHGV